MKLKKMKTVALCFVALLSNISMYSFADDNIHYNDNIKLIKSRTLDNDTWLEKVSTLPINISYSSADVVDGKVYVIGGYPNINSVNVYDPHTNTWDTSKTSMPTARHAFGTAVLDGKIYCIGGSNSSSYYNKVEVYDPATDSWNISKSPMPTPRAGLGVAVIDDKIYCIGGSSTATFNKVEVYNPKTDTWETKASMPQAVFGSVIEVANNKIYSIGGGYTSTAYKGDVQIYNPSTNSWTKSSSTMPTPRRYLSGELLNGKIYCFGGQTSSGNSNKVEVYDVNTDTWNILTTSMPLSMRGIATEVIEESIYTFGGYASHATDTVNVYIPNLTLERQNTLNLVEQSEISKDLVDIEIARDLVNKLPESAFKNTLQYKLNDISPNISIELKKATSNLDLYIKSENMLTLNLDTNCVNFDNFSGIEDTEKQNAINLTVNSSLPYKISAYLPTDIQNVDKSEAMDKSILNIKASSESTYNTFTNNIIPVVLLDNQTEGNNIVHAIDLMLKGNIAHKADVYKTTIKLEIEQK